MKNLNDFCLQNSPSTHMIVACLVVAAFVERESDVDKAWSRASYHREQLHDEIDEFIKLQATNVVRSGPKGFEQWIKDKKLEHIIQRIHND